NYLEGIQCLSCHFLFAFISSSNRFRQVFQPLVCVRISSNIVNPLCCNCNSVPFSFGTSDHTTIELKVLLPSFVLPLHEYESLVNVFTSNTSQSTMPAYLLSGFGVNLN